MKTRKRTKARRVLYGLLSALFALEIDRFIFCVARARLRHPVFQIGLCSRLDAARRDEARSICGAPIVRSAFPFPFPSAVAQFPCAAVRPASMGLRVFPATHR